MSPCLAVTLGVEAPGRHAQASRPPAVPLQELPCRTSHQPRRRIMTARATCREQSPRGILGGHIRVHGMIITEQFHLGLARGKILPAMLSHPGDTCSDLTNASDSEGQRTAVQTDHFLAGVH
ncbi:hypothetical protein SEVIR_9G380733v4 [Setaria viridis]